MHYDMDMPMTNKGWGYFFNRLRGLEEIKIEFKTEIAKKLELEAIIWRALRWVFHNGDAVSLVADASSIQRSKWKGPPKKF